MLFNRLLFYYSHLSRRIAKHVKVYFLSHLLPAPLIFLLLLRLKLFLWRAEILTLTRLSLRREIILACFFLNLFEFLFWAEVEYLFRARNMRSIGLLNVLFPVISEASLEVGAFALWNVFLIAFFVINIRNLLHLSKLIITRKVILQLRYLLLPLLFVEVRRRIVLVADLLFLVEGGQA